MDAGDVCRDAHFLLFLPHNLEINLSCSADIVITKVKNRRYRLLVLAQETRQWLRSTKRQVVQRPIAQPGESASLRSVFRDEYKGMDGKAGQQQYRGQCGSGVGTNHEREDWIEANTTTSCVSYTKRVVGR